MFTLERGYNNLLEEGDLSEQEASGTILLAVHTQRGDLLSYKSID